MEDLYSRELTSKDLPFIMDEFEEGAKLGAFSKDFSKRGGNKVIEKQLREIIRIGQAGYLTGHYFHILIRESNEQKIGYVWLASAPDSYGQTCLEIRAFGITKAFRGKGYASLLLSKCVDGNSHHPMQAKCLVESRRMADMLKRRGFELVETTPTGTSVLFRHPR